MQKILFARCPAEHAGLEVLPQMRISQVRQSKFPIKTGKARKGKSGLPDLIFVLYKSGFFDPCNTAIPVSA